MIKIEIEIIKFIYFVILFINRNEENIKKYKVHGFHWDIRLKFNIIILLLVISCIVWCFSLLFPPALFHFVLFWIFSVEKTTSLQSTMSKQQDTEKKRFEWTKIPSYLHRVRREWWFQKKKRVKRTEEKSSETLAQITIKTKSLVRFVRSLHTNDIHTHSTHTHTKI